MSSLYSTAVHEVAHAVIAVEDLDKYFNSVTPQSGKLAGCGRFLEQKAAA